MENMKLHITDTNQRENVESSEGFIDAERQQERLSSVQSSTGNETQSENATNNRPSLDTDTSLMGDEVCTHSFVIFWMRNSSLT